MLYVFLKGHDYKYEVAELIKLFTNEFSLLTLINVVIIWSQCI